MADEKTLFNKNEDNEDEKHPIAKEIDDDFVDFSAAFADDDDEKRNLAEFDEEVERSRSIFPLRKGLSSHKRKKDLNEESSSDDDEIKSAKKEKKNKKDKRNKKEEASVDGEKKPELQEMTDNEESISHTEVKAEEKKPEKKKRFSLFDKKEKKDEVLAEEEKVEEVDEQLIQQETSVAEVECSEEEEASEEIAPALDGYENDEDTEEYVFVEESREKITEVVEEQEEFEETPSFEETNTEVESENEETGESVSEETTDEKQKPRKKFAGFALFNKRQKVVSAPEVNVEDEAEKKEITDAEEFEEIPPFKETVEEEKVAEEVEECTSSEEQEIEEQENSEESVVENEETVTDAEVNEEASTIEPMTMKDHLTFILIIVALLLAIVFISLKFIPLGNNEQQNTETAVITSENVSEIVNSRKSIAGHLIQSDIENVFYAYSQDYNLKFYQSYNKGMKEIKPDGSVNAIADVNNEKISVKIDYVKIEGELFGVGLFRKRDSQGNYLHDMVVFKLVNLPEGYVGEGKALLLATSNSEAVSQNCNVWENSFVIDLETGATTNFISNNGNAYLSYSILTNEGYASVNGKIPFFTTRDYDATTNKKDIYLKSGNKETPFAKDVAGSYVYVNGDTVCYLKNTDDGFKVVRNSNGKETLIFSLDKNSSYLYHNEYLLDKYNGILYNVKTGKKVNVTGYGMSNPELMTVSDDGKYLVVLGNVNSAIDYQVHIFDLEKNEYAKYVDDNFSNHKNLVFVGKSTIVYSVVEPNQGCEYVMIDASKAFK